MKTCKLQVANDTMGGTLFHAYQDCTITHPTGKNITTRFDEIKTKDAQEAISFLTDRGVESKEIKVALNIMEDNGHDKAEFGMFGGFIMSSFTGVNQ